MLGGEREDQLDYVNSPAKPFSISHPIPIPSSAVCCTSHGKNQTLFDLRAPWISIEVNKRVTREPITTVYVQREREVFRIFFIKTPNSSKKKNHHARKRVFSLASN